MSTTDGFDLLAEIGDRLPNDLAHAFWVSGRLPNYIHAGPEAQGTPFANLEVFFGSPMISFENDAAADSGVIAIVRQHCLIRNDTVPGEVTNEIEIRIPVRVEDQTAGDVTSQSIVIDLGQVDAQHVRFPEARNIVLEVILVQGYIKVLHNAPVRIPVTPPMLPAIRFFVTAGQAPVALKVFGNIDGRDGASPRQDRVLLPAKLYDGKSTFPNAATAVNGGLALSQIQAKLIELNLVDGQVLLDNVNKKLFDLSVGGSVTINPNISVPLFPDGITLPLKVDFSPTLERIVLTSNIGVALRQGEIQVTGSVHAEIDNAFDADADFDVGLWFSFAKGKFVAHIFRASIDVDSSILQMLMGVLFGPIGLVIGRVLDRVIDEEAVSAVTGMSLPIDIPKEILFLQDFAITRDDDPITVHLEPHLALISPDSVGVQFVVTVKAKPVQLAVPTYFVGHQKSKEVHRDSCRFVQRMSGKNKVLFVRAEEAVAEGYDGCRWCLLMFDGAGGGSLNVAFRRPAITRKYRGSSFVVEGKRVTAAKGGSKLAQQFSVNGPPGFPDDDGYWNDLIHIGPLAPGTWSVTLTDGGWTATKTISVRGGGIKQGTRLEFLYGKDSDPVGPIIGGLRITYRSSKALRGSKPLDPYFQASFQGPKDGTPLTEDWYRLAGQESRDKNGTLKVTREAPCLKPGTWLVKVSEYMHSQSRMVKVSGNETRNIEFQRVKQG